MAYREWPKKESANPALNVDSLFRRHAAVCLNVSPMQRTLSMYCSRRTIPCSESVVTALA